MTDERAKEVVEALRYGPATLAEMLEAADELERLREENAYLRNLNVEGGREMRRRLDGVAELGADALARTFKAEETAATKDAEIARLREALRPFAEQGRRIHPESHPDICELVRVGDLKRAAEVLK